MNKFIGVGRLTANPEIRYSQSGTAVANFNIAISSGYGEHKQTDFIPVVAFKNLAEIIGNNLSKGSQVLVEGRMQNRSYENNQGEKRFITEVVLSNIEFVGTKKKNETDTDSFGAEVQDEQIPFWCEVTNS